MSLVLADMNKAPSDISVQVFGVDRVHFSLISTQEWSSRPQAKCMANAMGNCQAVAECLPPPSPVGELPLVSVLAKARC